jgi:Domain of unknown function (DUF4276)
MYLAMALHAEGLTDHAFLEPVIRRALRDCAHQVNPNSVIEIAPFVDLPPRSRDNEAIFSAVERALDGIHLFFLHTDGKGQPERARLERVAPIFTRLRANVAPERLGCVCIIPVHETEAWPLADPECIRHVFGTIRSDAELGLQANPHEVENELDPKQRLGEVWRVVSKGRKSRRRKDGYKPYLAVLGETIDLARLRRVPAYQRFEQDLATALRGLMRAG